MSLISPGLEGWRLNRINCGPPYHVEIVGPYRLAQVCDERGTVALGGPNGAVFCATREQADQLCELANTGMLEHLNPEHL